MAGAAPDEAADQLAAGEIEVADAVEHLVADELVGKAQALLVQHPVLADHDRVLERAAERQAARPQLLDPLGEAEGAGARDLGLEVVGAEAHLQRLAVDQRMVELDLAVDLEAVGGLEPGGLAVGGDARPA